MDEIYITEDEFPVLYEMVEDDCTDEDLDNLAEFCESFLEEYNTLVEQMSKEEKEKKTKAAATSIGVAGAATVGLVAGNVLAVRKEQKKKIEKLKTLAKNTKSIQAIKRLEYAIKKAEERKGVFSSTIKKNVERLRKFRRK